PSRASAMPSFASAWSNSPSNARSELQNPPLRATGNLNADHRLLFPNMWFKPQPKNRRVAREHVLDVKIRSTQARRARTRTVAFALGVAFACLFAAYLLWRGGEWGLNQLVYQNKAFAL